MTAKKPSAKENAPKKNRFLLIFICIFLSITVLVGGGAAIAVSIINANAVARYGGVRINEGVASYLAASYKRTFLGTLEASGVNAYDSESFWEKKGADGVTYGELLSASFKDYLASLLSANAVYLEYGSWGADEKRAVRESCEERMTYVTGTKEKFNEIAAPMGFDYSDFISASELLYRADKAEEVVYGKEGSRLTSFTEDCEKYLATYSHVALIFIRQGDLLLRDEEGNIVYTDGVAETRPQTAEEREKREAAIKRLRELIAAVGDPLANEMISEETFVHYMRESDGDPDMYTSGYYLRSGAVATEELRGEFPEVVGAALEMEIGEYREVACPAIDGVCFIYRYAPTSGAYFTDNKFLTDFYKNAPSYLFPLVLGELSGGVIYSKDFDPSFIVTIPKNKDLYVKQWK